MFPARYYLRCFFLFVEGFLVCRFSSGALSDCSVRGSSGKVQCDMHVSNQCSYPSSVFEKEKKDYGLAKQKN